jgi:urease accessory protein UreH
MDSPFPKSTSKAGDGQIVVKKLPSGLSALETITYQYPLKLISPSKPAEVKSALVFLLSYGGGLVGGDTVHLAIVIQENARLSIVTQGHTKIFKSATRQIVTSQTLETQIASGAALCLLPDPVQPFEESVYEQTQVFKLAASASLCLLDWVTQGRSARGEDWSFFRWQGRNEVWMSAASSEEIDRLLVRDTVKLDADQKRYQTKSLRDTMHGMGVVGTLVLRGPLMSALGEFMLSEFEALPRLGARDFRSDDERTSSQEPKKSPLEEWRAKRIEMEQSKKLLWSAANVRGCVVVKFGAPEVETARLWIGSMLYREGSISSNFGDNALMCVR